MLQSVSDAQAVTEDEAQAAEKMRLAQDALNDSIGDLKLTIGQTVAGFAPLLEQMSKLIDLAGQASVGQLHFTEGWLGALGKLPGPIGAVKDGWDSLFGSSDKATEGSKDTAKAFGDVADNADAAAAKTDALNAAYDALHAKLDFERDSLNVQDAFARVEQAAKESWQAAASGADNAGQKARDYQRSIITAKDEALKFLEAVGQIPSENKAEILADVNRQGYAVVWQQMEALAADRHANILVKTIAQNTLSFLPGFGTVPLSSTVTAASAGLMAAPSASPTATAARTPVVVNVNASVIGDPGAVAQAVTAALTRYQRLNGPRSVQLTRGGLS
jgi:hypothetical protein